jgi:hypothetical protein
MKPHRWASVLGRSNDVVAGLLDAEIEILEQLVRLSVRVGPDALAGNDLDRTLRPRITVRAPPLVSSRILPGAVTVKLFSTVRSMRAWRGSAATAQKTNAGRRRIGFIGCRLKNPGRIPKLQILSGPARRFSHGALL